MLINLYTKLLQNYIIYDKRPWFDLWMWLTCRALEHNLYVTWGSSIHRALCSYKVNTVYTVSSGLDAYFSSYRKHTFQCIVNTMRLPWILNEQHAQEQVHVVPQLMAVRIGNLPQQLAEHCAWEVRVLPAAELQQLHSFFREICILDQLLDVAATTNGKSSASINVTLTSVILW